MKAQISLILLFGLSMAMEVSSRDDECRQSSKYICSVPFGALYAQENPYAQTLIAIKGFLHREGESYALYPDETSMRYLARESALEISGIEGKDKAHVDSLDGCYVRIVGVFRASGSGRYWGTFKTRRPPQEVPIDIGDMFTPAPPKPIRLDPTGTQKPGRSEANP